MSVEGHNSAPQPAEATMPDFAAMSEEERVGAMQTMFAEIQQLKANASQELPTVREYASAKFNSLKKRTRRALMLGGVALAGGIGVAGLATAAEGDRESVSTGTTAAETTAKTSTTETSATTGGTEAEEEVTGSESQTAPEGSVAGEPARQAGAEQEPEDKKYDLEGATTVNSAVKNLEFTTPKGATTRILNNPHDYNGLKVSHDGNKQNALKSFDKNMSTANAAEAWALGVVNSSKYSQDFMNGFEGKDGEASRNDSHEERIEKISKIVSHKDTDFNGRFRLNGPWDNGSIVKETKELDSKVTPFNNVRAFQIRPGNNRYEAVYAKIGGGNDSNEIACMNSERDIDETPVTRTTTTVTTTTPPQRPPQAPPVPPEKPPVPPEKPPVPPKKPPVPPEKPPVPPKKPPVPPKGGKDHTKSPVTGDRNHPEEERRPNIETPAEVIRPEGAGPDNYRPPQTVEVPAGVDPPQAEPTPATGQDNSGTVTAP